nr:MAG TPA: hypothetical protein [Caudoviricetes sp.]
MIMILLQCHNVRSYGFSTFIIPMSSIIEGSFMDNTAVVCTSPDGWISSLTFTISKTCVFNQIALKSNNQYFVPKYALYYK